MALSRDELVRYARHLALRDVGIEGQERLRDSRILLVGAGGLGSPAALYLAAAGVGTLGVVDADRVDATNLQRQIAHGTADLGRLKVESAAERIRDLNPHVQVVEHPVRIDRTNALDLVKGYDLVIDGSDNFPTRYLVNDACVFTGVPFVYGAILRWDGQVSLFATPDGPCYRCLFREPPPPGLVPSCSDAGVFGVLPGVIGSMQALEALKWVLRTGDSLAGRLLLFDALESRWREIEVPRAPDCPVCGEHPTITELVDYDFFCGVSADGRPLVGEGELPHEIEAEELHRRLRSDAPPLIVDVRERWEWDAGNLATEGALHLPLAAIGDAPEALPRDRPLVLVCSVGARSAGAAGHLRSAGFSEVAHLRGGLAEWTREIDPQLTVL
ncbi:molybdopterin-synthase adenylyltransferase MoeB [Gaopeijia maritima]|uniref:molybdopterin-synthase adenylyltransferase MoeB n=1 Tax=Gaopeijia maritima TaxID=3119007 RepID=UPI00327B412C